MSKRCPTAPRSIWVALAPVGRGTPVSASGPAPGETTEGSPGIWDLYHALETPGGVGGLCDLNIGSLLSIRVLIGILKGP